MGVQGVKKLFICYIPGLDLRRIDTDNFPYITDLFNKYPWVKIRAFPSTELVPTLLTGVYPHEHGIWQVKLKPRLNSSFVNKFLDKIPEGFTTTLQCLVHLFNRSFDLACIPSSRRRLFEICRFKYTRREKSGAALQTIGLAESIFSIVGEGNGKYIYNRKFKELNELLSRLCLGDYRLEFLELYALDLLQHWNLNNGSKMRKFHRITDLFVKNLHAVCQEKSISLMILSDHGQERVKGSIDLKIELKKLNLSEDEYTFFLEVPMARFWFHTDRARRKIVEALSSIDHGTVLSYEEMHKYNIKFDDARYGEVYFVADPGYIIFPNDFYHPLANIFLGLTDWQQRSRILSPKHRGNHGYLPGSESERGFMMMLDTSYKVRESETDIINFAPTVLGLLGYKKRHSMHGKFIFEAA
jgi:hypothetical protein